MLTFLVTALVAVSALGSEGTHPLILVLYRSLLFAITLWCGRQLYRNGSFSICPRFLVAGVITCLLMLSFLREPSTFEGFYYWYQLVLFAAAFVVFGAYSRSRPTSWKLRILWLVVAVQTAYVVAGLASLERPIHAGFANPDYLGSFLLVGFSICLSIALFRTERLQRVVAAAGCCFFYFGIIETLSRGATVAAFLIVIAAVFRYGQGTLISKFVGLAVLGVLLIAGAIFSPALVRKFSDTSGSTGYNYMRPKIWAQTLHLIRDNPVFGIGLGQFMYVSQRYTPALESERASRYAQRPGIAHSEYLQYAAETGVPAALLLLGLTGYLMCMAVKRANTCGIESRAIQEAAILSTFGLAGHALFDNNWIVPVMAAWIVVFGLADVLPDTDWKPSPKWTMTGNVASVILVLIVYAHSTLIPGIGLWFNQLGYQAFAANALDKAEADYEIAADILPLHSPLLDDRGMLCLARYQQTHDRRWIGAAEDFFAHAADANPNAKEPLSHLERALILSLTGDVEADRRIHPQIAVIDRDILRVDPFDPFVRKNLAEALYREGRKQEAQEEIQRALQVEPNYVAAYLTMANWENEAGNIDRAAQYRQKAMDIVMKYPEAKRMGPYDHLLLARPETANP